MSEGLTAAWKLDGRGGSLPVDRDAPPAQGECRWLRFNIHDDDDRAWLKQADVPEPALEALLAESTRPRFMAFESGLLLVLRGINLNPGSDTDDMIAVRVWLARDRILTSQRRTLRSAAEVEAALGKGRGARRPGDVLVQMVERLVTYIEDALDELSEELESTEERLEANPREVMRSGLILARRRAARIRRFLLPQREALERLCRLAGPWLDAEQVEDIQQSSDTLTRLLEDLELTRERAVLVQDELQNRIAQDQNSRVYLLAIVTAIFLPLTFVTGLLGMNVAGLPGMDDNRAFWFVVGASTALGVGLAVFFRFRRWL